MSDTIWTMRGVNEPKSSTRGWLGQSGGDVLEVHDPSLSPDWLRMPVSEKIPAPLRGKACRVLVSTWFPLSFCPEALANGQIRWVEENTRWHLLSSEEAGFRFAVIEARHVGWSVISMDEERFNMLLEYSKGGQQ